MLKMLHITKIEQHSLQINFIYIYIYIYMMGGLQGCCIISKMGNKECHMGKKILNLGNALLNS